MSEPGVQSLAPNEAPPQVGIWPGLGHSAAVLGSAEDYVALREGSYPLRGRRTYGDCSGRTRTLRATPTSEHELIDPRAGLAHHP